MSGPANSIFKDACRIAEYAKMRGIDAQGSSLMDGKRGQIA